MANKSLYEHEVVYFCHFISNEVSDALLPPYIAGR